MNSQGRVLGAFGFSLLLLLAGCSGFDRQAGSQVESPAALSGAYLAAHGEAPAEGRKKKRKGAGRARENTA